jgi:hypothetical protein
LKIPSSPDGFAGTGTNKDMGPKDIFEMDSKRMLGDKSLI